MPDEQGVTITDSLTGADGGNGSSQGKGKNPTAEQLLANAKDENERKALELQELKAQIAEMREERLAELEAKENPTRTDEAEIEKIKASIRSDARAKPWLGITEEIVRDEVDPLKVRLQQLEQERAMDFVSQAAKSEGVEQAEFEKLLVPIMKDIDPSGSMDAYTRSKKSFNILKRELDLKKKEVAMNAKQNQNFSEGSGKRTDQNLSGLPRNFQEASSVGEKGVEFYLKQVTARQAQETEESRKA